MIIYSGNVAKFNDDVLLNNIGSVIENSFFEKGIFHSNDSEFASWVNSLRYMQKVIKTSGIDDDINLAVEYQIPMTSKRVDFLITGKDENNKGHVLVIELKQWETAEKTSRDGLVSAYTGGGKRVVAHPCYQAYSYAKTIENFNAEIQDEKIMLHPCAYLHNYKEKNRSQIDNYLYSEIIEEAPLFLEEDAIKLGKFICKFIKKSDNGALLYKIDNGRIRPSKSLQDSLVSMMHGNKEFVMIDEQMVAYSTIKKIVQNAIKDNKKYTIIVEGGPGTGKSVIAINLLSELIKNGLNVSYVTKNSAPRNVYFEKLKQGKNKLNYINNLFRGSGQFVNCNNNQFDCLLIDEAHRLNAKSGIFQNYGENQIKEMIKAALVSVFFIDENQVVTSRDIGSIDEIKRWADLYNSEVYYNDDTKLASQFRCNGSDGYIAFLDDLLGIQKTANCDGLEMNYDLQFFSSALEMKNALALKNQMNNKSRIVAGYCYEWITKVDTYGNTYDIVLDNGEYKAKWNFGSTKTWAIDKDTFDQVGCIHTSQGLEFDYIGVIIGKDLLYRENKVITNYAARAKSDQSLKGIKNKDTNELVDRIIRNTYKTLMTRGQKGCYIYCEDEQLREYLKKRIKLNENIIPF